MKKLCLSVAITLKSCFLTDFHGPLAFVLVPGLNKELACPLLGKFKISTVGLMLALMWMLGSLFSSVCSLHLYLGPLFVYDL